MGILQGLKTCPLLNHLFSVILIFQTAGAAGSPAGITNPQMGVGHAPGGLVKGGSIHHYKVKVKG